MYFARFVPWVFAATLVATPPIAAAPNFVIIFCDDLGYGDLGCYGNPTIRTPRLDQMAAEGMRFTQFYSAAPVCTPSRAALLTGRLPIRSGMASDERRVLFPDSSGGLPAEEVTLAEALKAQGYATACVGKWHLGHLPQFLPTRNGFDSYFGIPYSNDMLPSAAKPHYQKLPLMRDEEVVETEPDQATLTERYTEEALALVDRWTADGAKKPFFLYLAHTMPHVPLYASSRFTGISSRGLYGDVVETIDWSTGQILDHLRDAGVAENTLVLFTSDNGPWLIQNQNGGTAGLLFEGKGSTWEGGMREPCLAWWPGHVPANQVSQTLSSTLDLLPTFLSLAAAPMPQGRTLDGYDLAPVLLGQKAAPREVMYYYRDERLFAVRKGPWKAHFKTQPAYNDPVVTSHDPALLYNLDIDPSERFDVAKQHPKIVAELTRLAQEFDARVERGQPQLEGLIDQP